MSQSRDPDERTAPTSAGTVKLEDVHLTLPSIAGPVDILRGISLEVDAGETVGIVGPSGSGKTSMMMLIAGLERPSRGRIRVGDAELSCLDEDRLALFRRREIGIVFQNFHLVANMTALENVALPLDLAGRSDALSQARSHLEAVGLGHRLQHYPGQLSGGEQQRVALARAFVGEPALLLADEPTGNLDGTTGHDVMELLFALREHHGTTLMLITHAPDLAARCARTVHMLDGRIAGDERHHAQ